MGIDFIRRAAPSFRKGLDRRRIELATPTLFTQEPAAVPRAYAAQLRNDKPLAVGDKLGVRLDGQNVLAMRGLDLVALFKNPTAELKSALSASFGEACGTCTRFTPSRVLRRLLYAGTTSNSGRNPAQSSPRTPPVV